MAGLTSATIAASYDQLLIVDRDGGGNTTTHVAVKDGDGDTTFPITLATDAIMITSTNRLEFGDDASYIHQSADGVLDLVSDTEIEINATTIDINGAVDMSSTLLVAGTSTFGAATTDQYIDLKKGNSDKHGIIRFYRESALEWSLGHASGESSDAYEITSGTEFAIWSGSSPSAILVLDSNSRTSLSNNDSGTQNTIFGKSAGASLDAGSNYNVFIGDSVSDATMNDASNNVGIGQAALGALTSGDNNVVIGMQAGIVMTSQSNCVIVGKDAGVALNHDDANGTVAVGSNALAALTSGSGNLAIGFEAGKALSTGTQNIAIGYQALDNASTSADWNVAIGNGAMGGTITTDNVDACVAIGGTAMESGLAASASGSVAVGYNAAADLTDGNVVAIGYRALEDCTTGANNLAVGYQAMAAQTTGTSNIAIGHQAMYVANHANCDQNTVIGYIAGNAISTGAKNTLLGNECGTTRLTTGSQNTAIGAETLGKGADAALEGSGNTCLGYQAGLVMKGAANSNVFLGREAGAAVTTGTNHVIVGDNAEASGVATANEIVLGNNATGTAASTVLFGAGVNTIRAAMDGSTTSWTAASSDERYKENIETSTAGLSFINDLRPVTYNWKKKQDVPEDTPGYEEGSDEPVLGYEYGKTLHGFIAQEVKSAIENHSEIKEGFYMWQKDNHDIQTVADGAVIPILVKAVQELSQQVEDLKKQIN